VGLINVKLESGEYLIKGKKVTGFSNAEEDAVGLTSAMPFLLEDKLKERGGVYSKAPELWKSHVVRQERVITGQNPASATKVAQTIVNQIQDL
jgi:putative intracellular protease/amidase